MTSLANTQMQSVMSSMVYLLGMCAVLLSSSGTGVHVEARSLRLDVDQPAEPLQMLHSEPSILRTLSVRDVSPIEQIIAHAVEQVEAVRFRPLSSRAI